MANIVSKSVGQGGANFNDDVATVQFLLNDWRLGNGLEVIAVDGIVGPKTIEAIRLFQQRVTHVVDGRVDPNGPTITKLAELHVARIVHKLSPLLRALMEYLDDIEFRLQYTLPVELKLRFLQIRPLLQNVLALFPAGGQVSSVSLVQRVSFPVHLPVINVFGAVAVLPAALAAAAAVALLITLMLALTAIVNAPLLKRASVDLERQIAILQSKALEQLFLVMVELQKIFDKASEDTKSRCRPLLMMLKQLLEKLVKLIPALADPAQQPPPHLIKKVREAVIQMFEEFMKIARELAKCMGVPGLIPPSIPPNVLN